MASKIKNPIQGKYYGTVQKIGGSLMLAVSKTGLTEGHYKIEYETDVPNGAAIITLEKTA